ncbi:MAG: pyrroline-5-carboxylate reductase [Elusimicrobiota bacterium]
MKGEKVKDALNKKIGFIGAGNIAEAIISGIIKSGIISENIFISDVSKKRLNYICKKYKVIKCYSNSDVVKYSDIIFLAVKPYQIEGVLEEIKDNFDADFCQHRFLISVAAGIKTSKIEKYLKQKKVSIVRVMPNIPVLFGEGAIAITAGRYSKKTDVRFVKKLLSSSPKANLPGCGMVVVVAEKNMDAVTSVSGSGPAYIFYIAEIMRYTAEKLGLTKDVSKKLVYQTLFGASKMLVLSDAEPEILRQKVTSKGGTTEAAFKVLLGEKFGKIFEKAIFAAAKRSEELSNG